MLTAVLAPGAVGVGDTTRTEELTSAVSTDSQSFQAVFHNWQHPDPKTRPAEFAPATRLAHWAVGGLLTLATVAAGRVGRRDRASSLVFLGCLCAVMMLLTPVSHMHYYALPLPLVAGLWLGELARRPGAAVVGGPVVWAAVAWGVLTALPLFPGEPFEQARDFGLGAVATVGLWAVGVRQLVRAGDPAPPPAQFSQIPPPPAAAVH